MPRTQSEAALVPLPFKLSDSWGKGQVRDSNQFSLSWAAVSLTTLSLTPLRERVVFAFLGKRIGGCSELSGVREEVQNKALSVEEEKVGLSLEDKGFMK